MEDRYISMAKHAIGLDRKKPHTWRNKTHFIPYRNYYYANPSEREDWETLVAAGYAIGGRKDCFGFETYSLTRTGLDWLGERLGMHIYNSTDMGEVEE